MKNVESCIIEMSKVSVLFRMIDETFIGVRAGFSDDEEGTQLEQSLILLREQFERNVNELREAYYGGVL